MNNRSFLGHALVFGIATLLTSAGNFVLIPMYTRYLPQEEYGGLEVLGRVAELAGTLLLVSGLKQGLMTLYQQKDEPRERSRTIGAAFAVISCFCLFVGALTLVMPQQVFDWLEVSRYLTQLAVLAVVLEPFHLLPLALIQSRLESTRFLVVTVTQFLTRIVLSVVFVIGFGWGVAGVLGATALNGALFGLALSGRELWRGVVWPDRRRIRELLRFALPFLPSALCFFMLQQGDRFFLNHWCGKSEVAIYSVGYKLAQAVVAFSLGPLYMVWSSQLYAAARTPDAPVLFGRAFTRILTVFLLVGLGVSLFETEAITLLAGPSYATAVPIIAPVLLACFFQSAAALMDAGFYIRHRTGLKLGITMASTLVIALLYAVLIPLYHGMGAALATLGGFAFLAVCTWRTTQQIFPVRYEPRLLGIVATAVGIWLLSRLLPPHLWLIPLRAALWLAWPLLLWYLGLVSNEEKQYVLALVRRPFGRLRPAAAELRRCA